MRKIIVNVAVTLDGFIEGPNGEIDWINNDAAAEMGEGSVFDQFLATVDAVFYGRISYDLWGQYKPDSNATTAEKNLWQNVHSKTKYVFSNHPAEDGKAIFISSAIAERVHEIKQEPGSNIWLYGGGSLISSFMNEGLVDAFQLAVYPVILGKGKPLFSTVKNKIDLNLKEISTSKSGVAFMNYERV
ncbi:dihydrofolate reductase family protein [Lacibacter sp.]|uniref:dihydrofolate reductase family protein n=1 Tax=Lacibacter sp. TaxID=1915409 RepID=UPI002B4ABD28|nr:dihydrofolate reductase family protein [Lacibacter sp.]HLP39083.1 dihydrofolate reductase family protein [Lacibacter sp.]